MVRHEGKCQKIDYKFSWPSFINIVISDITILPLMPFGKEISKIPDIFFIVKLEKIVNESNVVFIVKKNFSFINAPIEDVVHFHKKIIAQCSGYPISRYRDIGYPDIGPDIEKYIVEEKV